MTKLALLALALALAHAQFLGYEDSSLQSTACTPDGSKVKTCSVSVSPDPVVKGGYVAISIDATLGSTQTIEKIELKLGVFPLDTITLDSPVECSPGCSININYQTKAVTPTGSITVTAVPKISSGSSFGYVDVALKVVAPTEESLEAQPSYQRCSGSATTSTLDGLTFDPYPAKQGRTLNVEADLSTDVSLTGGKISIGVLTEQDIAIDIASCQTGCTVSQSKDLPPLIIGTYTATARVKSADGVERACYTAEIKIVFFEEENEA